MTGFFTRGFQGKKQDEVQKGRVPPGQYITRDFPVLTAGGTPRTPLDKWDFRVEGEVERPVRWTWDEFMKLPKETFKVDIHCVTRWSKLGTAWEGVSVDTLLEAAGNRGTHVMAFCDGEYTTNMPVGDVAGGKAWVVFNYEGTPLHPEHGGPARLLVPHLYFWKSAKWVRGLRLMSKDNPGFWEQLGYHNHGDPWTEERNWGD